MKLSNLRKEDFYPTGAVQSAPIFYFTHTKGAARAVRTDMMVINQNGVCEWFARKSRLIVNYKNWLLDVPDKKLDGIFRKWKKKWAICDNKFHKLAISPVGNWRDDWRWLDKTDEAFWFDPYSYRIELIDPYADEIERMILNKMTKAGVDEKFLHEFISPTEPTLTQKIILERINIKKGLISPRKYIDKYWYGGGNWNGGFLLDKKILNKIIKEKVVKTDFRERKRIQTGIEQKLDTRIIDTVKNLRLLTLWREERKAFMQKINLSYLKISERIEKEIGVPKKIIAWARPGEIGLITKNQSLFEQRRDKSIYYYKFGTKNPIFMVGKQADKIIKEFTIVSLIKEFKGTIASRGKIVGRARIILKEHQFFKFENKEILITTMTRPEFIPIAQKASAIITDEGGLTSHAAIISRELDIPCIVGTKIATKVLHDGDLVEVDANKGVVKVIK